MGPIARDVVDELPAPRLTCREVVELLSDYLEDGLSAGERARVDAHLATCPDCLAYLTQLRTTIGALGRLREDDVPRPMLARLVDAFRGWRGG
jgi:anti-sigma factor RsiW